ncbi:MAG TPA: orotidine-5'-phosphate decarboxylase [Pyrinomonadaceae bacterium]|nr:orotidine-5'-phosphate decarboxylase [Pyrinomonadaceae bacterium]
MNNKLIIALDVETADEARRLFSLLGAQAGMFKIGSQLFTAAGPQFVREIVAQGGRVFLDLKFHDIPNTVAAACREAVRLGVSLFNVHAAGGGEMMRRAAEATGETAEREGLPRPALIAVTVLTSADAKTLAETGIAGALEEQVKTLAKLAALSGLDGVVASPHEIAPVRSVVAREKFLLVTPGVRPSTSAHDDQKRVMTPAAAVRAGADYIVVGRAILNAPDPLRAAHEIVAEMERAAGEPASSTPEEQRI